MDYWVDAEGCYHISIRKRGSRWAVV